MQGVAYADMFSEMTNLDVDQIVILIGVDTANFAQTLIIKKDEMDYHRQELHKYIEAYYNKT
jgi:DNA-binding ferritin-like protein (Dps family)